ncbi:MAG: PorT family protein [Bacteroidota bacterium]|nr:PorT family protein [Bacteroidota bacterium]
MKKIVFLLFSALTISFASQAQIGIKLGANLSNLAGDLKHEDLNKNKIGFVGGLSYNIPLSGDNFLSLQPELLYSMKGYKYADVTVTEIDPITSQSNQVTYEGKVNYSYLDLPILLKVNAGPIFFEAGPQLSYLLSIKDNTEKTINGVDFESYQKIDKDKLAELEIGYAAGLGFQAPMGITIGLRYNGSFSHLAKDDNGDELANARNSLYQATVGFRLPTGK